MKSNTTRMLLCAAGLLALTSAACVEEEPSILLRGSLILDGTEETVTAVAPDGTETEGTIVKCTLPSDATGSNSRFFSRGSLNIQQLKSVGQDGPNVIGGYGGRSSYTFVAGFYNRLPDSRSSGGNGMTLDQNIIQVKSAEVSFLPDNNRFNVDGRTESFSFEATRPMSTVLDSDGGATITSIPIFNGGEEIRILENFLKDQLGSPSEAVYFHAEIKIVGKTLAGTDVESNAIVYPIEICLNCGVTNPTCLVN